LADRDNNDDLEPWTIPSYERVFRQERKIHQIQGHRLPRPVPLPVLGWFFSALLVMVIVGRVPGIGKATDLIPFPIHWFFIPGLVAYVATRVETEGRPVLKFLMSWFRSIASSGRRSLGRTVTDQGRPVKIDWSVWITRDQYVPYLRRATIIGPAKVEFRDRVWAKANRKGESVTVLGVPPSQRPLRKRLTHGFGGFRPTHKIVTEAGTSIKVLPL